MKRTASLGMAGLFALLTMSCVLPDRDIVLAGQYNAHAVRIVEPTYLSQSARAAICESEKQEDCEGQINIAPIPHHLTPDSFPFCRCANPKASDPKRLPALRIWVEEGDQDPIYAALLLDSGASQDDPAFWEYFSAFADPTLARDARPSLPPDPSLHWNPYHRAGGPLREILLGNELGMDLCNAHPKIHLDAGWHTLTVLVTDRPWHRSKERQGPSYAIPAIAQGATFARTEYSFYCQVENIDDPSSCHCPPVKSGP